MNKEEGVKRNELFDGVMLIVEMDKLGAVMETLGFLRNCLLLMFYVRPGQLFGWS